MPKLRLVTLSLGTILLTIFFIDQALWKVDPSGVVRYFHDHTALYSHSLPAPDGLRYTPGTHQFNQYRVTIGLDGFRAVPSNRGGECRIAFIGDSVTFGMGSDVSFVDVLATDIDAYVLNAGIPGYNIENIRLIPDLIEADGYIYLVVQNDGDPPLRWVSPSGKMPPATMLYLDTLTSSGPAPITDDYFQQYAVPLLSREDVLAFAFEGMGLTNTARELGAIVIPAYTGYVSKFDVHPNPEGAQQIAATMHNEVMRFVERQCKQ